MCVSLLLLDYVLLRSARGLYIYLLFLSISPLSPPLSSFVHTYIHPSYLCVVYVCQVNILPLRQFRTMPLSPRGPLEKAALGGFSEGGSRVGTVEAVDVEWVGVELTCD